MMKEFCFKKIDAFATSNSDGNPAGYISLNSLNDISESEMLQIAQQMKGFVNEVGFASRTGDLEFDLRYYSAEKEVYFCGHATIAIMYDLIKSESSLAQTPILKINTNRGKLLVYNQIKTDDSVFIMSPIPEYYESIPKITDIADKLKIDPTDIQEEYPASVINAGLTTLLVPIKKLDVILNIKPDLEELKAFCIENNIDIIEVFTPEVSQKTNQFRTRVFAPTFGYLEDPATGSGNSALGYYLIKHNLWQNKIISIEQNASRNNYNLVKLCRLPDENGLSRICFGGGAITRIEGKYMIY